ncbi:aminoglycoside phosphotransferase family protein [bacterium]|nr:aminoglycoside phosphotransferase family protein [bacterium]
MPNDPASLLNLYPSPWNQPSVELEEQSAGWSGGAVWRVRSIGREGALRRWPESFPLNRIQAIHAAQRHAWENGCPFIPQVFHTNEGSDLVTRQGCHWELVEWMPGEPADRKAASQDQLGAAAVAMAQWHQVFSQPNCPIELNHLGCQEVIAAYRLRQSVPSPAIARRLSEWKRLVPLIQRDMTTSTFSEARFLTERTRRLIAVVHPTLLQLAHWKTRPVMIVLSLPDLHREHVLFSRRKVSGIIDLGGMTVDTPALDIARYASSFDPSYRPLHEIVQTMIESYRDVRGLEDSLESLIISIACVSTAIGAMHWWEWLTTTNKIPADRRHAAMRRWDELIQQLERWCDAQM